VKEKSGHHYIFRHNQHIPQCSHHEGIEGNELADQYAKEAVEGLWSCSVSLPPTLQQKLPTSITALKLHRKTILIDR
jgi:hypothetical protein